MKKIIALVLALLLVKATLTYAEMGAVVAPGGDPNLGTTTQINVNFDGQSNFEYIGAWGTNAAENPGYIVLKGCDYSGVCYPYYLWIDSAGNLRQASYATISAYASFPSGNWDLNTMNVGGKVGSQ